MPILELCANRLVRVPKKEFDFLVKNRLAIALKKGYLMYKQNNLFKQVEYKETKERGGTPFMAKYQQAVQTLLDEIGGKANIQAVSTA